TPWRSPALSNAATAISHEPIASAWRPRRLLMMPMLLEQRPVVPRSPSWLALSRPWVKKSAASSTSPLTSAMAPRALSARRAMVCSSRLRAWSSARSSQRRPSAFRPRRACEVPSNNARLGESSSSLVSREPRYSTTSAWCPAAASCWALSTTADIALIRYSSAPLPGHRVDREVFHLGVHQGQSLGQLGDDFLPLRRGGGSPEHGQLAQDRPVRVIHDSITIAILLRMLV